MANPDINVLNRFLLKVDNANQRNKCWNWKGSKGGRKSFSYYGRFQLHNKCQQAHRVSWWLFNGDIPNDMCVCHSCDNTLCVNPEHLWLGTKYDNSMDCHKKGRGRGKRLSDKEIERAKLLSSKGVLHWIIADELKVSRSHLSAVLRGERKWLK